MVNRSIKITLIKSPHHRIKKHKACAKGLGLTKVNQSVVRDDTPEIRGMVNEIQYMLKVEELTQ